MNDSDKNISVDGRVTVVLCLLSVLVFFNLILHYSGRLEVSGKTPSAPSAELCFIAPNKLVVENCQEIESGSVPARYAPFLFKLIPINSADKDMLMTVNGVGPALADTIVSHRQRIGPFRNSLDLQNLHGVGARRAARLAIEFTFIDDQ